MKFYMFVLALLATATAQSSFPSVCKAPIQRDLMYNCSNQPVPDTLPEPAAGETLADAVCCDKYYIAMAAAEPSHFYSSPAIELFQHLKLDAQGEVTFYDSVCGVPLFTAPRNRSFAEFQADTNEHGWPSFRDAELHKENMIMGPNGDVKSVCGTHLGHNLPDDKGNRYCIDLVCIAGHPKSATDTLTKTVKLATFNGDADTFPWVAVNDPVMGGQSNSSIVIEKAQAQAHWVGDVKIVPFLGAPGFCTVRTVDDQHFPDVTGTDGLQVTLQANAGTELSFWQVTVRTKGAVVNGENCTYKGNLTVSLDTQGTQVLKALWSGFELSWRGQKVTDGPAITSQLDQIVEIGLSTGFPGKKGHFDLNLMEFDAFVSQPQEPLQVEQSTRHTAATMVKAAPPPPSAYTDLATFDGASGTTFTWKDMNDPVMGGVSSSTFVMTSTHTALFNGTVRIVPSLKAPGFCNAETTNWFAKFNDASPYTHLMLLVRSQTTSYAGFKVSFAADTLNTQFASFKSNFNVTAPADQWQWVSIPFNHFSNNWSPFTGDCDTKDPTGKQHYCCSAQHPEVCPTKKNLQDISVLGLWAEGHAADFNLEIARIGAGNP